MEVASRTLREVEFRQQLRGYHQDDVDEFLERVAAGIEVLQDRLREANERAERAERALDEGGGAGDRAPEFDDEAVRRTLVLAQRTADLAVREAKEEATRITTEAEAKARTMVTESETRARSIVSEAEDRASHRAEESERQFQADEARRKATLAELSGHVTALEEHLKGVRTEVQDSLRRALDWFTGNVEEPGDRPETVTRAMDAAAHSGPKRAGRSAGPQASPGEATSGERPAGSGGRTLAASPGASSTTPPGGISAREQLGRMLAESHQPPARPPASAPPAPASAPPAPAPAPPASAPSAPPSSGRLRPSEDPAATRLMPTLGGKDRPVFDVEQGDNQAGEDAEDDDEQGPVGRAAPHRH